MAAVPERSEFDEERQEGRAHTSLDSHAGTLRDVYGQTPEEIAMYLEEERQSWAEGLLTE